MSHAAALTAPIMLIPAPEIRVPVEPFNPRREHVQQEEALEIVAELEQQRFNQMGSIEQYSGIHPLRGKLIVIITASSDAVIIPLS